MSLPSYSRSVRAVVLGVNGVAGSAIASELAALQWDVVGTGQHWSHFPTSLRDQGVKFVVSDRWDSDQLSSALRSGADVVVDCLCYTAEHANQLVALREEFGSAVVLSSKAVYADHQGRHSNSDEPPQFDGPVSENQSLLAPDFSGSYLTRQGYGSNKVAAELTLLDSGIPVSILRSSRIHAAGARPPREWFVVKRLLDDRRTIPLAHGGRTGNHPTAALNLARVTRLCAENPGQCVLNVADPGSPTSAEIIYAIAEACELPVTTVALDEDAPHGYGANPWDTWPPFFLDTTAAIDLGYHPVGTYAQTVLASVQELMSLSTEQQERLTRDPYFAGRFDYALDNAALSHAERSDNTI